MNNMEGIIVDYIKGEIPETSYVGIRSTYEYHNREFLEIMFEDNQHREQKISIPLYITQGGSRADDVYYWNVFNAEFIKGIKHRIKSTKDCHDRSVEQWLQIRKKRRETQWINFDHTEDKYFTGYWKGNEFYKLSWKN